MSLGLCRSICRVNVLVYMSNATAIRAQMMLTWQESSLFAQRFKQAKGPPSIRKYSWPLLEPAVNRPHQR
jgi:hypothetical protein